MGELRMGSGLGAGRRSSVARRLYLAAVLLLLAFLAVVALIIDLASREADRHALQSDLTKLQFEFQRLRSELAVEFADFTYWDDAVINLAVQAPSAEFIRDEIVEDGALELGYGWMAAVSPSGSVTFAVNGEQILSAPVGLPFAEQNLDLVKKARANFKDRRLQAANGYMIMGLASGMAPGIEAMAWRLVDGVPSLVIAQVIIPESEDHAIADGNEYVLLAQKPWTQVKIADLATRMEFVGATIEGANVTGKPTSLTLPDDAAASSLALNWQPQAPRMKIILSVLPFATVLLALLATVLVFAVRRYSRLIDRLEVSEAENRRLANHDRLTGLANRASFDAHVEAMTTGNTPQPFALVSIDLDLFKAVNDTHGHQAGDAVLVSVAGRFAHIVGERGIVARMGGDEFVAAISGAEDIGVIEALCEKLVAAARNPIAWEAHDLRIGASVGVAIWPRDGDTIRELMAAADRNLYRAKHEGRGRTVFDLHDRLKGAGFKAA